MRYLLALALAVALVPLACKQEQKPLQPTAEQPRAVLPPIDSNPTPTPVVLPTPAPTPEVRPIGGKTYTIKQGDTFYSISRALYGSDKRAKDIIAANPGIDPSKLKVGQVINLPEK